MCGPTARMRQVKHWPSLVSSLPRLATANASLAELLVRLGGLQRLDSGLRLRDQIHFGAAHERSTAHVSY